MTREWPEPPRRRSPMDSGNNSKDKGCCPMVAAVKSIKRRRYRLAARYARMSVRLLVGA